MRTLVITAALVAVIPGMAMAQSARTTVTTTVTTPAPRAMPASSANGSSSDAGANVFVPDGVAPSGRVPGTGGDGVIHEWAPQQPVVQGVPDPAASYPLCTHGRTDSCRNPNPAKELPYFPASHG